MVMRATTLTLFVGLLASCTSTTAYWTRPGATLNAVATESEACYRSALDSEAPSAFPRPGAPPLLLPRSEPPPALWRRSPREAAFERFDEQLRYERCMRVHGWIPVGSAPMHK
jgi:hypothetical protein